MGGVGVASRPSLRGAGWKQDVKKNITSVQPHVKCCRLQNLFKAPPHSLEVVPSSLRPHDVQAEHLGYLPGQGHKRQDTVTQTTIAGNAHHYRRKPMCTGRRPSVRPFARHDPFKGLALELPALNFW